MAIISNFQIMNYNTSAPYHYTKSHHYHSNFDPSNQVTIRHQDEGASPPALPPTSVSNIHQEGDEQSPSFMSQSEASRGVRSRTNQSRKQLWIEDLINLRRELEELKQNHHQMVLVQQNSQSSPVRQGGDLLQALPPGLQGNTSGDGSQQTRSFQSEVPVWQQIAEKDQLIQRQRSELAEFKTMSYSLGVKVNLMESKIKSEISKNVQLEQQLQLLQKQLLDQQVQSLKPKTSYQPLINRIQSAENLERNKQRLNSSQINLHLSSISGIVKPTSKDLKLGFDSVQNKRNEVNSFLDESSFVHSYLCGAQSTNKPHFHANPSQPQTICDQNQENIYGGPQLFVANAQQEIEQIYQFKLPLKLRNFENILFKNLIQYYFIIQQRPCSTLEAPHYDGVGSSITK